MGGITGALTGGIYGGVIVGGGLIGGIVGGVIIRLGGGAGLGGNTPGALPVPLNAVIPKIKRAGRPISLQLRYSFPFRSCAHIGVSSYHFSCISFLFWTHFPLLFPCDSLFYSFLDTFDSQCYLSDFGNQTHKYAHKLDS